MKYLLLLGLFVLVQTQVSAQNNFLFIGARGGLNTSVVLQEIVPEGFTVVGRHVGYHFGPTIYFEPKMYFGLNSGIIFNSTGWVDKVGSIIDTLSYRKDVLQNIQIPISLSLKFGIGDFGRLFFEGGGYAQYAISGYSDITDASGNTYRKAVMWAKNSDETLTDDFSYKRMNMGVILGLGYQHKFITVGASYNLGLFDVTAQEIRVHNHIWNMYVCFRTWKRKI